MLTRSSQSPFSAPDRNKVRFQRIGRSKMSILHEFKLIEARARGARTLYDDQRNAQRVPLARRVKGKIVLVLEGVMFAVGLLMVAVPSYIMFIERGSEASRS
jgi:hypothetical protein